ncbi:tRNA (guanine-1-)-methyltransferase [Candidatus Regiella insecticola LSR1]|uniref:tRNA (guanine-N(1)-)-methyltransferase n=1 Tax=Candidatus Regiella insecticola LSR1 TaxID=663321 RepID=E0WU66_9ENTR|nr:tRNA (guanine-1-)-methyltransferase [Candidatus Regiella insecticola LSR1]
MTRSRVGVVSLFPEMFRAITDYGVTGRAVKNDQLKITCWDPRKFTIDRHHTVDDRPYGGGPGMLMMVQPLCEAIHAAKKALGGVVEKVIYLSPQGRKLDQQGVRELATHKKIILVCGRYEGIDERVIDTEITEEWSIGDYVLSGGELPAMVLLDAISRFIPGVLGHQASAEEDSFVDGLLDCPHYTRPERLEGLEVPAVLLSGNHAEIQRWRLRQSLGRTWLRRPELLENLALTDEQKLLLAEFQQEHPGLSDTVLCKSDERSVVHSNPQKSFKLPLSGQR